MAISKEDVEVLANLFDDHDERDSALAVLKALDLPDRQGAGHSSFVEKVRTLLRAGFQVSSKE